MVPPSCSNFVPHDSPSSLNPPAVSGSSYSSLTSHTNETSRSSLEQSHGSPSPVCRQEYDRRAESRKRMISSSRSSLHTSSSDQEGGNEPRKAVDDMGIRVRGISDGIRVRSIVPELMPPMQDRSPPPPLASRPMFKADPFFLREPADQGAIARRRKGRDRSWLSTRASLAALLQKKGLDPRQFPTGPILFLLAPIFGMVMGVIVKSSARSPTQAALGYAETIWLGMPGSLLVRLIQVLCIIYAALSAFESMVAAKKLGINQRGRLSLSMITCVLMITVGLLALASSAFCVIVIKPEDWYHDLLEFKSVACAYTNLNLTTSAYDPRALLPAGTSRLSGPYTMPDTVVRPPLMASPSFAPLARTPSSDLTEVAGLQSLLLAMPPLHATGALDAASAGDGSQAVVSMLGLVVLGLLIGGGLATSKPWAAVPTAFLHGATKLIHSLLRSLQIAFAVTIPFYYAAQHSGACDPTRIVSPGIILMCTSTLSALLLLGILMPALFMLVTRTNFFSEMKTIVLSNAEASLFALGYASSTAANSVVSSRSLDQSAAASAREASPGRRASGRTDRERVAELRSVVVDGPRSRGPTPRPSRAPAPLHGVGHVPAHALPMSAYAGGILTPSFSVNTVGPPTPRAASPGPPSFPSRPVSPSRAPPARYSAFSSGRPSLPIAAAPGPGNLHRLSLTPLPVSLDPGKRAAAEVIGPSRVVHSLVTSVSAVLNFSGILVYEAVAAYAIARVSPTHRTISFFTVAGATCLVALFTCGVGLPCTALPTIITVLKILGIDQRRGEVGTLLAVDFFMDRLKALLTVWIDLAVTRCIALAVRGTAAQGLAVLSPETFQALGIPQTPLPRLSVLPPGAIYLRPDGPHPSARPSRMLFPINGGAGTPRPSHGPAAPSARQPSVRFDAAPAAPHGHAAPAHGPRQAQAPPYQAQMAAHPAAPHSHPYANAGPEHQEPAPAAPVPLGDFQALEATLSAPGLGGPGPRLTDGAVGRISFAVHVPLSRGASLDAPGSAGGSYGAYSATNAPSAPVGTPGTPSRDRAANGFRRPALNIIPEVGAADAPPDPVPKQYARSALSPKRRHTQDQPLERKKVRGGAGGTGGAKGEYLLGVLNGIVRASNSDPDLAVDDIDIAADSRKPKSSRRGMLLSKARKAARSADEWRSLLNQEGPPTPPNDSDLDAMPVKGSRGPTRSGPSVAGAGTGSEAVRDRKASTGSSKYYRPAHGDPEGLPGTGSGPGSPDSHRTAPVPALALDDPWTRIAGPRRSSSGSGGPAVGSGSWSGSEPGHGAQASASCATSQQTRAPAAVGAREVSVNAYASASAGPRPSPMMHFDSPEPSGRKPPVSTYASPHGTAALYPEAQGPAPFYARKVPVTPHTKESIHDLAYAPVHVGPHASRRSVGAAAAAAAKEESLPSVYYGGRSGR